MDIKTFIEVATCLPSHIAVLAKGPTGIGKSHVVHQIAKNLGQEVLDKRLAYMTEGDIVGLPELVDGVTRFAPVDWIVRACNEPVVLFLDELNRATLEVQQCAFQLVLDRELNGNHLHPQTRVFVAINEGSDYQVTEMDPALLRRFYSTNLEPTVEDWMEWAQKRKDVDPVILEYIRRYPAHLRHTGEFEPGVVYPNPASWHRLSESLIYANLNPEKCCGDDYKPLILSIAKGFIGDTTATAFVGFLKEYKIKFSVNDIFEKYNVDKNFTKKIDKELTNDKKNDLLRQIAEFVKNKDVIIPLAYVERACLFSLNCSEEMTVNFMNMILESENVDAIKKFHRFLGTKIVKFINDANNLNKQK